MDTDYRTWVEEAIALCRKATEANVSLMIRGDFEEIGQVVVSSATDPNHVRQLGQALSMDYVNAEE